MNGSALTFAGRRDLEEKAASLLAAGQPFALATVVFRRPPVSSHLGDRALISADGQLFGWIGGSCSQGLVRQEALAALASGTPRLIRLTTTGAPAEPGRTVQPMACPSGGEVEVYIEPYGVPPRLVACGDTPVVHTLARLAELLGWECTVVHEETELARLNVSPRDLAVVASAGAFDEAALARVLTGGAGYVGLVASRRRAGAVLAALQAEGVEEALLASVRAPTGLDIGAVSQEEIAVSILAELIQERRRMASAGPATGASQPLTLVDPVCGMTVLIEEGTPQAEYEGMVYAFCCPHCRQRFLAEPARYAAHA